MLVTGKSSTPASVKLALALTFPPPMSGDSGDSSIGSTTGSALFTTTVVEPKAQPPSPSLTRTCASYSPLSWKVHSAVFPACE